MNKNEAYKVMSHIPFVLQMISNEAVLPNSDKPKRKIFYYEALSRFSLHLDSYAIHFNNVEDDIDLNHFEEDVRFGLHNLLTFLRNQQNIPMNLKIAFIEQFDPIFMILKKDKQSVIQNFKGDSPIYL